MASLVRLLGAGVGVTILSPDGRIGSNPGIPANPRGRGEEIKIGHF